MVTGYTFPVTKEMVCAKTTSRVSHRTAAEVCYQLNGMNFKQARDLLEKVVDGEKSFDGNYYTNTSKEVLSLLKLVEANANNRGMFPDEMTVNLSAHRGPTMLRGRRKRNYGMRLKICHIHAVLRPVKKIDKKPLAKKKGDSN